MSTEKRIYLIGISVLLVAVLVTALIIGGIDSRSDSTGILMDYEGLLFSQDRIHSVDIFMEDWEGFLKTCPEEQYTACTVIINGERFENVGIRSKGNSSLTTVAEMDSNRYSFKLEFDHYDSNQSYHGLDKLNLNNLMHDNTMMKDYLTYQLMAELGAAAPLCSYAQINVNQEPWGLYLAVEAIEESFLLRNYGNDSGELYKPDAENGPGNPDMGQRPPQEGGGNALRGEALRQALEQHRIPTDRLGVTDWEQVTMDDLPKLVSSLPGVDIQALAQALAGAVRPDRGDSSIADVKLQYINDNPNSYPNIFNNAKTDITEADKIRLVQALKRLSTGKDLKNTVNIEPVIRYFVVHTFVCNEDSYTGSMVHNYYLYEKDGVLSMLPWDYNLAFGGIPTADAASVINASIHNPVSGGDLSDRPMLARILENDDYAWLYDRYYIELLNVDMEALVEQTEQRISPYVEKDTSKFCTYEQYKTGVAALKQFLELRIKSVQQQLRGETANLDPGDLDLSAMGGVDNRTPPQPTP